MSEHTTHIPEIRRLERSRSDRMLAGVGGGLARYFEIHPAVFRVGFVVLTLLGGAGILIYVAAWLVMPDEGEPDSVATRALRERRDRPWPLIGLGLIEAAGAIVLSRATLWPDGDAWWLLLLAGGLILLLTRHKKDEPAADEPTAAGAPTEPGETTTGQAVPAVPRRRKRRVLRGIGIAVSSLVALLVIALAIFVAVFDVHPGRGIGKETYVVTNANALRDDYRVGIGALELDLSRMEFPRGVTRVETSVDVGDLKVIIPPGVALRGYGEARAGHVNLLGKEDDGWNADVDLGGSGERVLDLVAHVGAGSVRVERAVR